MIYKKIILKPKSGLITPLESDTVLSYIFAYNFIKLEDIYNKFINGGNIPFIITNGFLENTLPKPIYFNDNFKDSNEKTLNQDIEDEIKRKDIKKLSSFPVNKDFFELLFEGGITDKEEYDKKIEEHIENNKNQKSIKVTEYKNSIPRFNSGETNPYEIDNVLYTSGNYTIYVKVNDEKDFDLFFDSLKDTFEKIGFGKGKSRGYGHFKKVEKQDFTQNEKEVFEYIEKLKEKNMYLILNNFKPNSKDLEKVNLDKSNYLLNTKHTKSLNEFNKNIFKGQMNFICEGSVIYSEEKLVGDSYKSDNSYNFGFIF